MSFEPVAESAPEITTPEPEPALPQEAAPLAEAPAEPVFIEEQAPLPPPPSPPAPEFGRTMMFRLTDIAQPVLSDEMAPAPAVAEQALEVAAESATGAPTMAEGEIAAAAEPESPPVSAASLESYSLSEAAAGHVRFAAPDEEPPAAAATTEATPAVEEIAAVEPSGVAEAASAIAAAPAPTPVDPGHIYTIVQMVVAKMSPRLGAEAIAEMARTLADEINAELNASSSPNP